MIKKLSPIKLTAGDKAALTKLGFSIQEPFNSGEFGVVYKATRTTDDDEEPEKCAAKVIDVSKLSKDQVDNDLAREIFMMNRLNHPHVVTVYHMFRAEPSHLIVFMELAEGGDLCDLLSEDGWIEEYSAVTYYRQFGDALRYIHTIGYAHRDMKLENVLLNKERTETKLTDFGFSRHLYDPKTGKRVMAQTWCGTVAYMPPEMLDMKDQDHYCPMKADVWSAGVLLYALLNDDFPFGDSDEKWMVGQQRDRKIRHYNKTLSKEAKQVINMHLEPDPDKRPTMEEIRKQYWFSEDSWE